MFSWQQAPVFIRAVYSTRVHPCVVRWHWCASSNPTLLVLRELVDVSTARDPVLVVQSWLVRACRAGASI